MGWRDQLREGSFRGAAFKIRSHDGSGGRRGELKEFPERDEPWFEDLGRAARSWSIDAIVIGGDYMTGRDALVAACEAAGPGTLVHPFHGTMQAVCQSFSWTETTEEGGMARFSMAFVPPGKPVSIEVSIDTGGVAKNVAATTREAAIARFGNRFTLLSKPGWLSTSAIATVQKIAAKAAAIGRALSGAGQVLRTFESGLTSLISLGTSLISAPLNLARSLAGLVGSVASLGQRPHDRVRSLSSLVALPPIAVTAAATPARAQERINDQALVALVAVCAAAEIVTIVADMEFDSYQEAIGLRDELTLAFDEAATIAADAGDDGTAEQLDGLRRAVVQHITTVGGSLERLSVLTPRATLPALVIAQQLYGSSAALAMADDIVARNHVQHPGFVPGGQPIEVRSNG